jgi:glycosyltransferase involved in cell wall biosynthesis
MPSAGPDGRDTVGIVANEFFDRDVGRVGGFGWVAREAAVSLASPPPEGSRLRPLHPEFFTGELKAPSRHATSTVSRGVPLVYRQPTPAREARAVRAVSPDIFLTIDYRPNYDIPLSAAPEVPILVWVQDPRPVEDVEKVNSLRIPGADVQPAGIQPIDCRPLAGLAQRSRDRGRAIIFASPAPGLLAKVPGTCDLRVSGLEFLPYSVQIDPGVVRKSPRPIVVFLGRLDPIKRPWVFLELARAFPAVEFLFLGQSHFRRGGGGWEPQSVPENVRFLGHVEGWTKHEILRSAWILVNTSIHEALPVSFVESLMYEMPIVSCQNPEGIVQRFGAHAGRWDGTGLDGLPRFAEGLRALLDDSARRKRLGEEGRHWAATHHNRQRFRTSFADLYERLRRGESTPFQAPQQTADNPEVEEWSSLGRAAEQIERFVPPGSTIILIDGGQCGLTDVLDQRRVLPFAEKDGVFWGAPADDPAAPLEFERHCAAGATHLVIVRPVFWYLDHYTGFAEQLRRNARCMLNDHDVIIFDLKSGST